MSFNVEVIKSQPIAVAVNQKTPVAWVDSPSQSPDVIVISTVQTLAPATIDGGTF